MNGGSNIEYLVIPAQVGFQGLFTNDECCEDVGAGERVAVRPERPLAVIIRSRVNGRFATRSLVEAVNLEEPFMASGYQ